MMSLDLYYDRADRIIREGLPASSNAFRFIPDAEYSQAWKAGEPPDKFGDRMVVYLRDRYWCE